MTRNYDHEPTFLAYSEEDLGVLVGGGIFGYGGVVLHEPTESEFHRIIQDAEFESTDPKGLVFGYSSVATITISGLLKWTNFNLSRAPEGRQDVKESGPVRIEIFDGEESRQFIEDSTKIIRKLGIKLVG